MIRVLKPGRSLDAKAEDAAKVKAAVEAVLADIQARGDAAVRDYSEKFDKWSPATFRLSQAEIDACFAALTPRQIELVDQFGYPYVLDQFLFHMTLSDRLPAERREDLLAEAAEWFAPALSETVLLDRLVIFDEPEPGAAFRRLDPDYLLLGA